MSVVLRVVYGEKKGLYFAGYSEESLHLRFSESLEQAERLTGKEAAHHTASLIDGPMIVVAVECLPDTSEEEKAEFCEVMARIMFEAPSDQMKDVIRRACVRAAASDPIYDVPEPVGMPKNPNYMSAWEWLHRNLSANVYNAADQPA